MKKCSIKDRCYRMDSCEICQEASKVTRRETLIDVFNQYENEIQNMYEQDKSLEMINLLIELQKHIDAMITEIRLNLDDGK